MQKVLEGSIWMQKGKDTLSFRKQEDRCHQHHTHHRTSKLYTQYVEITLVRETEFYWAK